MRHGAPVKQAVEAVRNGLSDVNFETFAGLPAHLYAAETQFGGWEALADEGLLSGMAVSPTILKIALPIVFNNARRRLEAAA